MCKNLNIQQGKEHVSTLCGAVLHILGSPDTTSGEQEPWGIRSLLGGLTCY